MNDKQRSELKTIIHSQIEHLQIKLREIREYTEPVAPDDAIGRITRMDAINNKSIYEASERNTLERIEKLHYALQISGNDDFGLCVRCRREIPVERLRIRPEVRLCVDCNSI